MILKKSEQMILSTASLNLSTSVMKKLHKFSFFVCIFVFFSCAASNIQKGERVVLNKMIEGKYFLDTKKYQRSKENFVFVAQEINRVWNKPEESKKVRQFWYEEGIKSFKGEPYERSMVFYYLGLHFLREKDYGNAQASFAQSILQDAFAEEEQNRADFAAAYFLQALAQKYLESNQLSQTNLKKFKELKKNFLPKNFQFGNSVFIIETGHAPRKVAIGKRGQYLSYKKGGDRTNLLKIRVDSTTENQEFSISSVDNVYWQAMSRGGRPIDAIAKNKVIFKDTTEIISDISLEIAKDISTYSGNDDALAAALVIGIGAAILSQATKTNADTRYWSNLPSNIFLLNLELAEGKHPIEIIFYDKNNQKFDSLQYNIAIKEGLNFFRWTYN